MYSLKVLNSRKNFSLVFSAYSIQYKSKVAGNAHFRGTLSKNIAKAQFSAGLHEEVCAEIWVMITFSQINPPSGWWAQLPLFRL